MKFRLKITLATIVLLSVVFGVGESILITVSFNASLENEKETATRSYRATQSALIIANSISAQTDYNDIVSTLSQLDSQSGELWSGVTLRLDDLNLYASGIIVEPSDVDDGTCSVELLTLNDSYYIHISGSVSVNGETLKLGILSDATNVYAMRDVELGVYKRLLVAVLLIGAIGAYIMASVLTRPLGRLSKASREIASGNLQSRAVVHSGDEFESLACDFNTMAEKLEENISELTDSMRRNEEFMGSFAHELKTPMTSIIGYADLLRSRAMSDDERQEAANYIFSEARRLESLSLKLLDILVLHHQDFELSEASPAAIVSSVVRVMKPILVKYNVDIKYRCDDCVCLMDPDLIKSLLMNLIDNARKAMDSGGSIFLLERATDTGCLIQLADTGCGMPESEVNRITEAFYRVDKSRSRAQGGVGLGLALCQEIVKLHNGTMKFKSIPGKGTNVTVTLNGGLYEKG